MRFKVVQRKGEESTEEKMAEALKSEIELALTTVAKDSAKAELLQYNLDLLNTLELHTFGKLIQRSDIVLNVYERVAPFIRADLLNEEMSDLLKNRKIKPEVRAVRMILKGEMQLRDVPAENIRLKIRDIVANLIQKYFEQNSPELAEELWDVITIKDFYDLVKGSNGIELIEEFPHLPVMIEMVKEIQGKISAINLFDHPNFRKPRKPQKRNARPWPSQ